MDYRGLYEDLLAMESWAKYHGMSGLAKECRDFRIDILMRFYCPVGRVTI